MPATESTWRNLKLMHVVFGVSSVAMLLTTVWMLAADHNRSWKEFQRTFRDIETWSADAGLGEQQSADYEQTERDLQEKLKAIQGDALTDQGRALFQQFVMIARTKTEAEDLQDEAADKAAADFIEQDANRLAGFTDPQQRRDLRMDLYNRLNDFIGRVRFREDNLARNVKFRKAAFDKATADYSLAVGKGQTPEQLAALQLGIDRVKSEVDQLTALLQAEQTHRKDLEAVFRQITAQQDVAEKNLKEHQRKIDQLHKALVERAPDVKKRLLELPILDAFNSPLKIDQIWLPNLMQNYNFRDVARFDRCNTCHQGINRTQPGSAVLPAYRHATTVMIALPTPPSAPEAQKPEEGKEEKSSQEQKPAEPTVEQTYGFHLTDRGPLGKGDATISAVFPKTPAAESGLMTGDVIQRINDAPVLSLDQAVNYLMRNVDWGKPLTLTVRRGMPEPYATHPKLNLFVGSMSPHPMEKFGCTICHQGQGSATAFEFASHTPSSPLQAQEWTHEYGWFFNHHWIYPMYPQQFAEAACLKCHHEVVDLEPSAKFPDPPAPTLVKGYEIVRNYGCFGCHEVNGFAGPQKRVGPDLRAEPVTYAAAAQIKADPGFAKLEQEVKDWVLRLVDHPEDESARHRLYEYINAQAASDKPRLSPDSLNLAGVLKDSETPGMIRKVGPSLRYVASKDSYDFFYSWISNPRNFRPTTKMPRIFGLWDHLVPEEKLDENGKPVLDANGKPVMEPSKGLAVSQRFEPIEIRAVANYLLKSSQPFEYLSQYTGITQQPTVERGKKLFETRGCLACHQHADFPQGQATQGPNLSRIGAKLSLERDGAKWLYSWLRQPSHYHARTAMPNTFLTPITEGGKTSDPAADITVYLMQSTQDWKPGDVPPQNQLSAEEHDVLYDLALLYLKEKFPYLPTAKQYLQSGIPVERAAGLQGDETLLVSDGSVDEKRQTERVLMYVGRRTINKQGCTGCHDIPGFEDAKPIGTALADWGRKDQARLAFEQIDEYVTHHAWPHTGKAKGKSGQPAATDEHGHAAPEDMEFALQELPPTEGWLMEKLMGHEREGFLWQKLRQPRSYDFKKTENKGYTERLRMPQFNLTEDEIEAVMTFVLGLVAEPPAPQYVASYTSNPREKSIIAGTKMVEQFNCTGCHQLEFQRWDVAYKSGELGNWAKADDFPFELPHYTQSEMDDSKKEDRRGLMHAQLYGRPQVDAKGEVVNTDENEDGDKFSGGGLGERFTLWHDVLIDGNPWLVGGKSPLVPENCVMAKYPGLGGDLGQWIYPAVVADELKTNPNAKPDEAWGWLPPPLVGEGQKVQTRWLHNFLLDPYPIRPAVVLRMPKFNMNSTEASALVEFFAARDNAPSPYEFDSRTTSDYLAAAELAHRNRLTDALKIVTDNNYCVKCHLVGEYNPPGSERAKGPQLEQVHDRLRPDFVHRWVGSPKRMLPYTGMPVNIPYDKGVAQALFPGDSSQQLDGVVDLLMNWDRFTMERFSIKPWIKPAASGAAGAGLGPQQP